MASLRGEPYHARGIQEVRVARQRRRSCHRRHHRGGVREDRRVARRRPVHADHRRRHRRARLLELLPSALGQGAGRHGLCRGEEAGRRPRLGQLRHHRHQLHDHRLGPVRGRQGHQPHEAQGRGRGRSGAGARAAGRREAPPRDPRHPQDADRRRLIDHRRRSIALHLVMDRPLRLPCGRGGAIRPASPARTAQGPPKDRPRIAQGSSMNAPVAMSSVLAIRAEAEHAPESGIVEVANYARGRDGLIPLYVGEGDLSTPAFIYEAATRALAAGETFYTWQRGIPPLREALARYHTALYGRTFSPEEFYVTGSGMQAIQIVLAMIAGAGDEVIIPTPTWPNAAAATGIIGGRVLEVPMSFGNSGWSLDLDRLAAAITNKTRALFIVSPNNPTGWTASTAELSALLALARRHGLWIVADETYARFWYGEGSRAPSFFDLMDAEDRILFVNTFSKNWAMTGWRIGWITAHPSLGPVIENMIQYATSGVAQFMQRAAVTALERGEDFAAHMVERARRGRDIACNALSASGRVRFAEPQGAFYLFFSVDGEPDTRRLALRLVDEANVGLAPGTAFGAGGERFMRLCFARSAEQLTIAMDRLGRTISRAE